MSKIALIQGGMGAERDVSYATAASFEKALKALGKNYEVLEADKTLPSRLASLKPSVALLAVHGKYAEDGTVQGICEFLKIPYTGSGVLASALCMEKTLTKEYLSFHHVKMPKHQSFDPKRADKIEKVHLEFPLVVKPSREGSSIGIQIAQTQEELESALREAVQYDHYILIEEFIAGKEVTVPLLRGKAMTPIEIRPQKGFYDYTNKYTSGHTEYILPPELSKATINHLKQEAERIYALCRLRGYGRVDFRVDEKDQTYFLEVNTLPGCTPTSLLPKAAQHDGIHFEQLIEILLEEAGLDYEGLK
ncbi:MAG: D-alanine--D-alanine ligase [Bdellovibrio sp.]|nr:MAG: D-alanine--D-alanine ligase [Bdellovibrio sp.]